MNVTSATSTNMSSAVSSAAASAGISSADFLTLLVSELKNQDPLQPTSTTDFVNQMSEYANFDEQQTLNSNFNSLLSSFGSLLTLNSLNYIGHTVEAKGSTATLTNGQATFGYDLSSTASSAQITISDSSGNIVWSGTGPTNAGMNSFTWNGKTSSGTQLADGGKYTIKVTATDTSGNSVLNYTTFNGKVDDISTTNGTAQLDVDGQLVNLSDLVSVNS
ncbi:MAG: Flagellar basal-body rod modification protein FlgD [Pseudolabrys sp.]|nr:Flagellar basal-body rod modification protein FlgD [Pseudolabrys sp.]